MVFRGFLRVKKVPGSDEKGLWIRSRPFTGLFLYDKIRNREKSLSGTPEKCNKLDEKAVNQRDAPQGFIGKKPEGNLMKRIKTIIKDLCITHFYIKLKGPDHDRLR